MQTGSAKELRSLECDWLNSWRVYLKHVLNLSDTEAATWEPESQYRFLPDRKFRFDFAFTGPVSIFKMVAIEVHGGSWVGGAHVRGKHFESDCAKARLAAAKGWRIFPFTTDDIRLVRGFDEVAEALGLMEEPK